MRMLLTLDLARARWPRRCGPDTALETIIITSLAEYSPRRRRRRRSTARSASPICWPTPTITICLASPIDPDTTWPCCSTPAARPACRRRRCSRTATSSRTSCRPSCACPPHRARRRALPAGDPVLSHLRIHVGLMGGTWLGAQQILIPKYDVEAVLNAMRDYRPTYFPAVPTIYISLLNHPKVREYGLDRVRTLQQRLGAVAAGSARAVRAPHRRARSTKAMDCPRPRR